MSSEGLLSVADPEQLSPRARTSSSDKITSLHISSFPRRVFSLWSNPKPFLRELGWLALPARCCDEGEAHETS